MSGYGPCVHVPAGVFHVAEAQVTMATCYHLMKGIAGYVAVVPSERAKIVHGQRKVRICGHAIKPRLHQQYKLLFFIAVNVA